MSTKKLPFEKGEAYARVEKLAVGQLRLVMANPSSAAV